ncbi:LytTR family DNA-binding domain-containing protein [Lachnospiraceae bacterium 45-W7]
MYHIAICDDEFTTINYYYEQLTRLFQKLDVSCSIDMFTDSGKLLSALYEEKRWDIYFLDIDMPLVNGLSLGRKIREIDANCYIIYISIHRERVFDSLEIKPFRFIPKDEFSSRIEPCIKDLLAECQNESESNFIVLESSSAIYRYRISDIIYAQSMDKYVTLFLPDQEQTEAIRYRISELEKKLAKHGFIRIHKSYLVNYQYIKSIHPSGIFLVNGKTLPLSRIRLNDIKTTFRRLTL